jgi:hypothetical protein
MDDAAQPVLTPTGGTCVVRDERTFGRVQRSSSAVSGRVPPSILAVPLSAPTRRAMALGRCQPLQQNALLPSATPSSPASRLLRPAEALRRHKPGPVRPPRRRRARLRIRSVRSPATSGETCVRGVYPVHVQINPTTSRCVTGTTLSSGGDFPRELPTCASSAARRDAVTLGWLEVLLSGPRQPSFSAEQAAGNRSSGLSRPR